MDRTELANRLAGFSVQLARDARAAVESPEALHNVYAFSAWPITPEDHDAMLAAARKMGASEAEAALGMATEYCDRLMHYAKQIGGGVPMHVLAEECAGVMDSVRTTLCPMLDRAAVMLRSGADSDDDEPLSEQQQDAYDFIAKEGPVQSREIASHLGTSESVVTTHIVPALKRKRGLMNKRSRGYYIPQR